MHDWAEAAWEADQFDAIFDFEDGTGVNFRSTLPWWTLCEIITMRIWLAAHIWGGLGGLLHRWEAVPDGDPVGQPDFGADGAHESAV